MLSALASWGPLDTWIVVTAALAAMACAVPGAFLYVRRQSMLGDALSHAALPGVAAAFLAAHAIRAAGWLPEARFAPLLHAALLAGAVAAGVFTAVAAEWVQRIGRVENSAALGVVFATLFALGLVLVRLTADTAHLDLDCVLFGSLEAAADPTGGVPPAAVACGGLLLANLLLTGLCYKELLIASFDPQLAAALGRRPRLVHYAVMSAAAATAVFAFEAVGSIVVIALLVAPAAAAHLLTDRLPSLLAVSLVLAALAAGLGHLLAILLPPLAFAPLGFEDVQDLSTSGMIAAAAGLLFVAAALLGPRHGVLSRALRQAGLALRIAADDFLGRLYRLEEAAAEGASPAVLAAAPNWKARAAAWRLRLQGRLAAAPGGYRLTETGRTAARRLVRSHRLWESYVQQELRLPPDHVHASAELAEHYLSPALRDEIAETLDKPGHDPHGRRIPGERPAGRVAEA